jgi:pre-mRNA-processing factor 6
VFHSCLFPKRFDHAREVYGRGLKQCPSSIVLYECASALEERLKQPARARAIIEKGRMANPKNPELWRLSIRIELKQSQKTAETMLAKALQECPNSG